MTSNMKDFINNNIDGFNDLEPSKDSWTAITERMGYRKRNTAHRIKIISMAAAATIAGIVFFLTSIQPNKSIDEQYSSIPELNEAEAYYTIQVQQKKESISKMAVQYPELVHEMNVDLAELDSIMKDLKSDLKDDVANPDVVEAMIQNYRMKLMILEEINQFLQKQNNDKKKDKTYEL